MMKPKKPDNKLNINKVKINDLISPNVQFDATVIPVIMSKKN